MIRNLETGRYSLVEGKATSSAPFTKNQKKALPELAKGIAGEVRGVKAERLGLESGDVVVFENVYVVRPAGVKVLK